MTLLDLVTNLLGVAGSLFDLFAKLATAKGQRREKMARLFEAIGDALVAVSAEIRLGNTPDGKCAEIETYAHALPDAIGREVGKAKAKALGKLLHSAHHVEQMVMRLKSVRDKERYLRKIDEAAGKFRALANMLRYTKA